MNTVRFELLDVLLYHYKHDEHPFPNKVAVVRNLDDNKIYLINQDMSGNLQIGCTWGSKFTFIMNQLSLSGDFKLYIRKHDLVMDPDNEIKVNFNEQGNMLIKGYYNDKKIDSSNIYPAYEAGTYPYKEYVTYYHCNKDFDVKLLDDAIFVDAKLEFDVSKE